MARSCRKLRCLLSDDEKCDLVRASGHVGVLANAEDATAR